MSQPAARLADFHMCPLVTPGTPPIPHVGGPIVAPGAPTVLIGGMPAAVVGDMATCVGPPDSIVVGSTGVLIGGKPAARMGDQTAHGGVITIGCPVVLIGEAAPGSAPLSGGGALAIVPLPDGSIKVGDGLIIQGDKAYQARVLADLVAIGATPTGGKLLASIHASGKQVTIEPTSDYNGCGYANPAGRFAKNDGTPGAGTDATVSYNSERTKIGDEPWEDRPPAIGLGHELVHAEQANRGTMKAGEVDNDAKPDPSDPTKIAKERTREVDAVGIHPNDDRPFTENKIRSEWDPKQPERKWY